MKLQKSLLAIGIGVCAQFALPTIAQEVESDLDITLTVVEETQNVQDVLNEIELPEGVREMAEQQLAAVMAAVNAARSDESISAEETEAIVRDAMARSSEMIASARLSADAANANAQLATEAAREAVEEAVKNALSGADINDSIRQMMQDIFDNLPDDVRSQLPADLDALFDQALDSLPDDPES
jgi:DNA-directed RNA polymerase subunit F